MKINILKRPPSKTKKRAAGNNLESKFKAGNNLESKFRYFLPHARLTRGQRKYCHCLMKARTSKNNVYGYCKNIINTNMKLAARTLPKSKQRQLYVNFGKTNCVMNYSYNDYSLAEIRALCREKGLPISETRILGNGKPGIMYYPKDRLVQVLVSNYISQHRSMSK